MRRLDFLRVNFDDLLSFPAISFDLDHRLNGPLKAQRPNATLEAGASRLLESEGKKKEKERKRRRRCETEGEKKKEAQRGTLDFPPRLQRLYESPVCFVLGIVEEREVREDLQRQNALDGSTGDTGERERERGAKGVQARKFPRFPRNDFTFPGRE